MSIPVYTSQLPPLPASPILYEVRTSVLLSGLSGSMPLDAATIPTLADIPEEYFQLMKERGVDILYLLGVWQTGKAAVEVSRDKLDEAAKFLAVSSAFAIQDFHVDVIYGGDDALRIAKARANKYGLRIMIDFIPNHVAKDHKWVLEEPWLVMQGSPEDAAKHPKQYFKQVVKDASGKEESRYIAYGRDQYSADGWIDTAQLNFYSSDVRRRMKQLLVWIASTGLADAVRCDMAMLVLSDVFEKTWARPLLPRPATGADTQRLALAPLELGELNNTISPGATSTVPAVPVPAPEPKAVQEWWEEAIAATKAEKPDFLFLGEVYWDMEFRLHQLGFDFTYDKPYYDKLVAGDAETIGKHLQAHLHFQRRSCKFVENHDEQRAMSVFKAGWPAVRAAVCLTMTSPGMRFLHDGQCEGRMFHHSMHIGPRAVEPIRIEALNFHRRLLRITSAPEFKNGMWHLAGVTPSKDGNDSCKNLIAAFVTPGYEKAHKLKSTMSTFPMATGGDKKDASGAGAFPHGVVELDGTIRKGSDAPKSVRSASSDSSGSGVIPEFVGLTVDKAAASPVPTMHFQQGAAPPLRNRTFLVIVNMSERPSDGHIVFARADASAYVTPEGVASVDHVFRHFCAPKNQGKVGYGVGLEVLPDAHVPMESNTEPPPSAASTSKLCLMDHLSDALWEYPLHQISREGWWVRVAPFGAHIFELFLAAEF